MGMRSTGYLTSTRSSLSVIIPNYNSGDYLKQAVKSVLSDRYVSDVIIIDNMSTDHSVSDVISLSEKVHVYEIQNRGVIGLSRNYGVSKSQSTWIAFLDADDLWEPFKTERLMPYFQNNDFLFHGMRFIRDKNNKSETLGRSSEWQYSPLDPLMTMLKYGNPIITSSVLLRRECFLSNSGFSNAKELVGIEDFELWIRLFSKNIRHKFIKEVLGIYRIHDKSHNHLNKDYFRCLMLTDMGVLSNRQRQALCGYCNYLFFRHISENLNGLGLLNAVKHLMRNSTIGLIPYILGRILKRVKG
jgi:glycosyltransferase involved in cell wall biosynthesis